MSYCCIIVEGKLLSQVYKGVFVYSRLILFYY